MPYDCGDAGGIAVADIAVADIAVADIAVADIAVADIGIVLEQAGGATPKGNKWA